MIMKRCTKCGAEKARDMFYGQKSTSDSLMSCCKECWKRCVRERRQTDPRVREQDRRRATQPHRIEKARQITKRWRHAHKDRVKAHNAAQRARLTRPALCEGCGLPKRVEKHHPDYSKPLLVVWLCKPCHAIADKLRRKLEAS